MKLPVAFALAVSLLLSAAAQASNAPDAAGPGPYAIGHTSFLVVDTTTVDPTGVRGTRSIAANVWYPADPSDITRETAQGLYPFDPIYPPPPSLWGTPRTSSDWEHPCDGLPDPKFPNPDPRPLCAARTIEFPPVYESVVPSANGLFPILLFSPGWNNAAVAYAFFATRLASHGFVVAVVQHPN